jgi:MFS family permease
MQGIGGASLMPVGRYVLVRSIAKREYVRAMSTVATFGLLGSVLGPLLGGLLVEFTSWRLIFLINVPVGLVGLWLNRREMPDYRLDHARRFDALGFAMFGAAAALLLVASEQIGGERHRWVLIGACTVAAAVLATLYVRHSRRITHPVADLTLLRVRSVWVALSGNLFTRLGVSGMFLLLVLFLQVGCGWSPTMAGLMMVPQALGAICAKWVINRLLTRLGYRRLLLGNTLIVAALIASFSLLDHTTPVWLIAGLTFVYGCFMGLQYTCMNTLVYTDLDIRHASMASSMASTAQYLSMSFGIALASLLMELFLGAQTHAPAAYVGAFHGAVLLLATITALAALVFLRLRPDRAMPSRVLAKQED